MKTHKTPITDPSAIDSERKESDGLSKPVSLNKAISA